jgi:hypothetical protein
VPGNCLRVKMEHRISVRINCEINNFIDFPLSHSQCFVIYSDPMETSFYSLYACNDMNDKLSFLLMLNFFTFVYFIRTYFVLFLIVWISGRINGSFIIF